MTFCFATSLKYKSFKNASLVFILNLNIISVNFSSIDFFVLISIFLLNLSI